MVELEMKFGMIALQEAETICGYTINEDNAQIRKTVLMGNVL